MEDGSHLLNRDLDFRLVWKAGWKMSALIGREDGLKGAEQLAYKRQCDP